MVEQMKDSQNERIRIDGFANAWYEDIPMVGDFVFENGRDIVRITEIGRKGWIGNSIETYNTNRLREVDVRDFLIYQIGIRKGVEKSVNALKNSTLGY